MHRSTPAIRPTRRFVWPLVLALAWSCAAVPPSVPADDVDAALRALDEARSEARTGPEWSEAERVLRLTQLGVWDEAEAILAEAESSPEIEIAAAELDIKRHRYQEATARVEQVLSADPSHREARLTRVRLAIQAWTLDEAAQLAEALLDEHARDEEAALLLGRVRLLEKRYDEALQWARRVQRWDRRNAEAHLLEADVLFWDQDPSAAEPALKRALELDPFNADARFGYGYAIWRRVDATQLDAMAAQWNLALELDPLHYVTHWHWGNGHTNLTYADYAHPSDSTVREHLERAHEQIAADRIEEAITLTRELERDYPESMLPALTRGSAFYMAYEMDRAARLDSAGATFAAMLERKPNYGPAHNGLAAVIKQWQFEYLASFDSLTEEIETTPLPDDPVFDAVFHDVSMYPGDRVRRMARQQLGPSAAFLPLLHRMGRVYSIPPLHMDIAEAMGSPRLRTATTFDNRQWMDIRGIGGGAAGIEYVERGSHWERNVLLHEFTHLFHGQILTGAESRRIRELYHAAIEADRALDYYAANNESEYLAQAYPAYLSPVKAHPLNHKSMNTHDDLQEKDPEMYAFVDSLITRQQAFLDGDEGALASNWAQVYVGLSEQARRTQEGPADDARRRTAAALLDTALVHDPEYLPAMLSYAALERTHGQLAEAERWLERAADLDEEYAPVYVARAELVAARVSATGSDGEAALEDRAALYREALHHERDLAERARIYASLRTLYADHGRLAEAVEIAEEYVESAPTLSTYLRDRRDEAAAFAHELRAFAGAATETLPFFTELVDQKPQHYRLREQYAEALAAAGRYDDAVATLETAQRILAAAGNPRSDFMVRAAEVRVLQGDTAAARDVIGPVLEGTVRHREDDPRLLRVLAALGESVRQASMDRLDERATPAEKAEQAYTRGWIAEHTAEYDSAKQFYHEALETNAYHHRARARLIGLLLREDRGEDADALIEQAEALPLPPDAEFRDRWLGEYVESL